MNRFFLPAAAVIAAIGSVWIVACLDMSPITVEPPGLDAAAPPIVDGGPDAPDVDIRPPCQRCIEGPDDAGGCGGELAACLMDMACNVVYGCVVERGCLERGTARAAIACGLPCAQVAGITDPNDPSVGLILNVLYCGESSCAGICVPEGGAALDGAVRD